MLISRLDCHWRGCKKKERDITWYWKQRKRVGDLRRIIDWYVSRYWVHQWQHQYWHWYQNDGKQQQQQQFLYKLQLCVPSLFLHQRLETSQVMLVMFILYSTVQFSSLQLSHFRLISSVRDCTFQLFTQMQENPGTFGWIKRIFTLIVCLTFFNLFLAQP